MQVTNPSMVMVAVFVPLIIWRVYARIRRNIGRQRLSKVRPWITLAVFSLILVMIASLSQLHPDRLAWLAGGLATGTLLAQYGLKLTRFEPTRQGLFYTPNTHVGIALSFVFIARIAYRFFELYALAPPQARDNADFFRSPVTLAVFGLLAGYYMAYAVGLLRWRFAVLARKREREAAEGQPPG
ncbi:MAG: hypothetical protein ACM3X5_05400 [Bacillota bacterium]